MGRAHSDTDPELALRSFDRSSDLTERHRLPLVGGIAATEAAAVIARVEGPGRGWAQLSRAMCSFIAAGDRVQLWTSAPHLVFFVIRVGRMEDACAIWRGLGSRPAFAARHDRDELTQLLGDPGETKFSDDDWIERIRMALDDFDRAPPPQLRPFSTSVRPTAVRASLAPGSGERDRIGAALRPTTRDRSGSRGSQGGPS